MSDANPPADTGRASADPMDSFVQMSSLLTGFAADAIAPGLDPVNLKATLFATAQKGAGKVFDELLAQYGKLAGGKEVSKMTPEERKAIGNQLLGLDGHDQDPARAKTAESVMRLWYLGYWYPIDDSDPGGEVASDQAYIRGLSWKSMQSHAMGYSTWQYGYWADPPPPLSDFTGREVPAAPAEAESIGLVPLRPARARGPVNATGQGKGGQSPAALGGDHPQASEEMKSEGGAS